MALKKQQRLKPRKAELHWTAATVAAMTCRNCGAPARWFLQKRGHGYDKWVICNDCVSRYLSARDINFDGKDFLYENVAIMPRASAVAREAWAEVKDLLPLYEAAQVIVNAIHLGEHAPIVSAGSAKELAVNACRWIARNGADR